MIFFRNIFNKSYTFEIVIFIVIIKSNVTFIITTKFLKTIMQILESLSRKRGCVI